MVNRNYVPLTSGFMLTSIMGFLVSVFFVVNLSQTWGFTFALFFVIMFISSVISMSNMDAEERYGWEELAIHDKKKNTRGAKK